MKPLRIELLPWLSHSGTAGLAFFSFCAGGSLLSGAWGLALLFGGFVWLSAFLLRMLGPIEADMEGIWQTTPSGRHEMKWSEITRIEVAPDPQNTGSSDIVLHGRDKRMALPGPAMWRAQGRDEMSAFIASQVSAWSIPREQTLHAAFQTSKNTKIARPKNPTRRPPLSP